MKLSIGQVSKIFNISKDTLRYYDKIGILTPEVNEANGYRHYQLKHLEKLGLILGIKYLGISLSDIKSTIESEDIHEYKNIVIKQEEIINKKIKELKELEAGLRESQRIIDTIINFENEYDFTKLGIKEESYTLYGGNIKKLLGSSSYNIYSETSEVEKEHLDEECFIYICNIIENKYVEEDEELVFIKENDGNIKLIKKYISEDKCEFVKKSINGKVVEVNFYGTVTEIDNYIISLNKHFKCSENNTLYIKYEFYLPRKNEEVRYFVNLNLMI
ncbi:MAG: MerR family transcriptional regulator [Clostridium sp.]|uniref:MerR family transcriptional regulator n=1 Tax=Clostridium sp. TaxID=1506 RepID=UPI0030546F41